MKTILQTFFLLSLAFQWNACAQTQQQNVLLNPQNFFVALQNEKNAQILDVRTGKEFSQGHLKDAINMDIYSDDFEKNLERLDKEKPVYVYCHSGGRSADAAKILADKKFIKVIDMDGGYYKWQRENLPFEK